ncbi:unnamed protein product [Mycetohabitans rhizoxinica HKI 454]|uniref:Uncharacterized protein n=1 Tax=Mycetohabitans rhizoxinica (strain DSM 19002 / CIP 109453 / HKI 454) TaxID=882378 RepID=E5AS09_MYCRK|nr:hypothetical protein [Mycetohabitans sp. B6]CBW75391.1 unnamed protein product [Mycetohabitans rhizoxinica HKI 454]
MSPKSYRDVERRDPVFEIGLLTELALLERGLLLAPSFIVE